MGGRTQFSFVSAIGGCFEVRIVPSGCVWVVAPTSEGEGHLIRENSEMQKSFQENVHFLSTKKGGGAPPTFGVSLKFEFLGWGITEFTLTLHAR